MPFTTPSFSLNGRVVVACSASVGSLTAARAPTPSGRCSKRSFGEPRPDSPLFRLARRSEPPPPGLHQPHELASSLAPHCFLATDRHLARPCVSFSSTMPSLSSSFGRSLSALPVVLLALVSALHAAASPPPTAPPVDGRADATVYYQASVQPSPRRQAAAADPRFVACVASQMDEMSGSTFFDHWSFFDEPDPVRVRPPCRCASLETDLCRLPSCRRTVRSSAPVHQTLLVTRAHALSLSGRAATSASTPPGRRASSTSARTTACPSCAPTAGLRSRTAPSGTGAYAHLSAHIGALGLTSTRSSPSLSIRLESKRIYNGGLFIFDLAAMPFGCSLWPGASSSNRASSLAHFSR